MNVGIDIDGFLTDIGKFQLKYGIPYFKKHYNKDVVNYEGFDIKEIFDCGKKEENLFWIRHIKYFISEPSRPMAKEFIKSLYDNGNKVYIITARVFAAYDDLLGKTMRKIVENWLANNGIQYEDIIYCKGGKYEAKEKLDAISRYNIRYMGEDKTENIKLISQVIPVLCMDAKYNKSCCGNNIKRIYSFDSHTAQIIEDYKLKLEKFIKDPITVESGVPSIDKVWRKKQSISQFTISVPQKTAVEYLQSNISDNIYGLALRYMGSKTKVKKLMPKVESYAKALKKSGVMENDIVTICMPNTPETLVSFLATLQIGAIASMIHPLYSGKEIEEILSKTESKYMVMADFCYEKVKKISSNTHLKKIVVVSVADSASFTLGNLYLVKEFIDRLSTRKEITKLILKRKCSKNSQDEINKLSMKIDHLRDTLEKVPINKIVDNIEYCSFMSEIEFGKDYIGEIKVEYEKDKTAVLLCTGGTTGTPKLVELTHENIVSNTEQLKYTIPSYKKNDELLAIAPMFHGFGLVDSVLTALNVQMSVDLHPQYVRTLFNHSITKNKPTIILGPPTLYKSMIDDPYYDGKDLSSLKVLISGSDELKPSLKEEINEWKKEHNAENPIFSGLGLTQATAAISFDGLQSECINSVGFPLPLNNVMIVDDNGKELGYNEIGELWVSGPTIMKGYYKNEEETKKDIVEERNGTRWLKTGDICSITENGEIRYISRKKGIIVVSGVNVYRNDVESIISDIDGIKDVAVVAMPHPYKMNVPKAYVVLEEGNSINLVTNAQIMEECNRRLNPYQKIRDITRLNKLPLTKLNKVDYTTLEESAKTEYEIELIEKTNVDSKGKHQKQKSIRNGKRNG